MHPLLRAVREARGNQRTVLALEPLYGIPYNLYTPFAAVYMARMGLSPTEIGLAATLNMLSQMASGLFGGILADRFGRRRSLVVCDAVCWCVPLLMWAAASPGAAWWFMVAAILNGMWRMSNVSYSLLLAEGADSDSLVSLYNITNMMALLAGFLSPLAFLLVRAYDIVPTVRGLYLFGAVSMTVKNILVWTRCRDTEIALRRMEETRGEGVLRRLWASRPLLIRMLKSRRVMLSCGITACYYILKNILDNFWPLFVSGTMGVAEANLPLFNTLRSMVMLFSAVVFVPRLRIRRFKRPMLGALAVYIFVNLAYCFFGKSAPWLLIPGTALEAFSLSVLIPVNSTLLTVGLQKEERARMLGFAFTLCLMASAPFGVLAGRLADVSRLLPLVLGAVVALACAVLTHFADKAGSALSPDEKPDRS